MHKLVLAAAVATVSMAGSAVAADVEVHSKAVSYADLDLTSSEGVAEFDQRIARAAQKVCGHYDSRSLVERGAFRRCRGDAIAAARTLRSEAIAAATSARPVLASAQ